MLQSNVTLMTPLIEFVVQCDWVFLFHPSQSRYSTLYSGCAPLRVRLPVYAGRDGNRVGFRHGRNGVKDLADDRIKQHVLRRCRKSDR